MAEYFVDECFTDIRNGANIKQNGEKVGYPITRIETIANDKFNRDRMGYAGITDISKYKSYILNDGDLLMSQINSINYLGRTVLYHKEQNEKIIHGMNLLRLQVNRDIVLPEYIEFLFKSFYFKQSIRKIAKRSVNQASFSIADFKRIKFSIPSLSEQHDVVSKLACLKRLEKIYQKEISKLDTLIKARFVEMFGDVKNNREYNYKKISDLTDVLSGGTPKRDVDDYWNKGTIPWVKTTELKNKKINSTEEYITKLGLQNSSAKLVPSHTVLIAMYGQGKTRGMTAYLEKEAATNQACACILPSSNINSEYLWQYLIMSYEELRNLAKGGNQPNLNSRMIKDFPILYPPIVLQDKFVSFMHQVDKSKVVNNLIMKYIINIDFICSFI